MNKHWLVLIVAGLFEVCWAIGLKYSNGFSKLWPSCFTVITLMISMYLLARATQSLPIGTAYAVWVGIGALGTFIMGIVFFDEPLTFMRAGFIMLLTISLIGLKITSS